MNTRERLYFLFGSGCCTPSVLGLSSDDGETGDLGFKETKSVYAADVIVIYGCINEEYVKRLQDLLKSAPKGVSIIRAGECIASGCIPSLEASIPEARITAFVKGCPFDSSVLTEEMKLLAGTTKKGKTV